MAVKERKSRKNSAVSENLEETLKIKNFNKDKSNLDKLELEPLSNEKINEKNFNFKKTKNEEERIIIYENFSEREEEFFIKYLKERIKNDQPFKILLEVCQKIKYNIPEVITTAIGKNEQFVVKIFISDFYFYGEGTAQSKKEGKSIFY